MNVHVVVLIPSQSVTINSGYGVERCFLGGGHQSRHDGLVYYYYCTPNSIMYRLLSDCAFSFSVSVTLTNVIDNLLIAMFRVRVVFECLNGECGST